MMLSRPRAAATRVRLTYDISLSFLTGGYPAILCTLRGGLWRVRPARGSVRPLLAAPKCVSADGVSQEDQEIHPGDGRRRHRPERGGGVGRHDERAEKEREDANDLQPSRKARQDTGANASDPEQRESQYPQETEWTERPRPVRQRTVLDQRPRGRFLRGQGSRVRLVQQEVEMVCRGEQDRREADQTQNPRPVRLARVETDQAGQREHPGEKKDEVDRPVEGLQHVDHLLARRMQDETQDLERQGDH